MQTTPIQPAFADPVADSQSCFRAILSAAKTPGTVWPVTGPAEISPLLETTLGLLLTLADMDTHLYLDQAAQQPAVVDFLRFHCCCPITTVPAEADFAVLADAANLDRLEEFSTGTVQAPHKSTTLIIQTESLTKGKSFTCTGPGIRKEQSFNVSGLSPRLWEYRNSLQSLYPSGLDVFLTARVGVCAIMRTTRVR